MPTFLTRRLGNLLGFLFAAALIAYALYAQYVLYLEPCPLCLFQRFVIIGMGVVFLVAALHNPSGAGARAYLALFVIVALIGIGIAWRHLYIQSLPAGSVPACGASLGYLFDIMSFVDVLKKVFSGSGECAKVDLFLGISWPWWVIVSVTSMAGWGVWANSKLK